MNGDVVHNLRCNEILHIEFFLCHEDLWGSGGIASPFLTSAVDGGEWSASRPGRFTPGTHCIGD
jgi:hypothetical protein